MHRDRADLAICGSTHIRAPYACAGGNDVVHGSFFQVTAGISQTRPVMMFRGNSCPS